MVVLTVTLFLFDAWHLINLHQWASSENGERAIGGLVHILLILLIAVFSWTLLASIIEHRLALELSNGIRPSARERTLLTLFRNVLAIVISTITIMIVLSQVGINIAPLLAGAGALGLAISFGAQTLVKDVITGVFIQFENGMNTGEYVTVGGITGTVERMTIRSIGLRDDYGVYHIVPFSSITTLANYAREFGVYRANYTVSRDEDIDRVNEVLHQAVEALKQDEQVKHFLIGEPTFNGVVALGDRSFTTRVTVRTQALKQWVVQYALDRLVKMHFDQAGISMPQQAMQLSYAPGNPSQNPPPRGLTPALGRPGGLLFGVVEGPGDEAADLLPLRHLDGAHFRRARQLQRMIERRQGGVFGNQRGEPQAVFRLADALFHHLAHEGLFAAFAPQFVILAAEVLHRLIGHLPLAQLVQLAAGAGARFLFGTVERRIAQRGVEFLRHADDAGEDRLRLFLQAQTHAVAQRRVHLDDHFGRVERHRVDFGTGKAPAVFAQADDRINAVGADADVEDRHALAARDFAAVGGRQQIRQMVQVVGAARDRRAQVVRRNVPMLNAIEMLQQRTVEHFHRRRVGEVDRDIAPGVRFHERLKRRAAGDQRREIVA